MLIPDLLEARNLLCVQPHYDDNDIAVGGTLSRLAGLGARLTYVTVSDDLLGVQDAELSDAEAAKRLQREQQAAGALIGVHRHYRLGYPDAGSWDTERLRDDLVRIFRIERPDFVLTCDPWLPYEAHPDHIRCGLAAAQALSLQGLPRLRTTPEVDAHYVPHDITAIAFYWSAAPNTTIDISAQRETKHRAIDCYRAQFSEAEMHLLHAALEHREREFAASFPYTHVEQLKVLRSFQLHCDPGAWRA